MAKPPVKSKRGASGKGSKVKKTPEEKAKEKHIATVRNVFIGTGFIALPGLSDVQFTFKNVTTDLDDYFVFENILVCVEYTSSKSPSSHLKSKVTPFTKILDNPSDFVTFLKTTFPQTIGLIAPKYYLSEIKVRIVYSALHNIDDVHQENFCGPVYMNYPAVQYFFAIVDAIKLSARAELMHFLSLEPIDIGINGAMSTNPTAAKFKGSVLPEAHSNFADGYKIVSFYAKAIALLNTAYVLRKDGWRDNVNLYQRMIDKSKVEAIRAYLKKEKRVFINNVIVTLPSDVKPLDSFGNTIDTKTLTVASPVEIQLPSRPNSVCIIDGQHRIFAYYETSNDDVEIASLRSRQNLLVTGIIYPETITQAEKEKFEARLFLEINSTQLAPKSDLKQAVGMIISPFAQESIATRVLLGLAQKGPLKGFIQQNFFDEAKLKTTSIVSYGLKPLVKTSGADSLFAVWKRVDKDNLPRENNEQLLAEYIEFCVSSINTIISAFKNNVDPSRWTADKKVPRNVISTSVINGYLIVLRLLIEKKHPLEFIYLNAKLTGFGAFDTSVFISSHYNQMAAKIVEEYFPKSDNVTSP